MSTTLLPGFQNTVHDAQRTFRNLLEALSHPGRPYSLQGNTVAPTGLTPGCAAACLTLVDLETTVWLQLTLPDATKSWLRFHTGCRFTSDPKAADFAVIETFSSAVDLNAFSWGSDEYPEKSTTLLMQVEGLSDGETKQLSGPGILGSLSFSPQLPTFFWAQWQSNNTAYPRGLDCFLFSQDSSAQDSVVGLSRTTQVLA